MEETSGAKQARRPGKGRIAAFVCGCIAVVMGCLFGWNLYYDHLYQSVGAENVPSFSLKVAGSEVPPVSAEVLAEISMPLFGSVGEKQLSCLYEGGQTGAWRVFVDEKAPDGAAVELGELGEAPYQLLLELPAALTGGISLSRYEPDGSAQSISAGQDGSVTLEKAGDYLLSVTGVLAKSENTKISGTYTYLARFSLTPPPPKFTAGRTALAQGDILSLRLENVPDAITPELETELGPAVFAKGLPQSLEAQDAAAAPQEGFSHWYAAVPIGNARAPGEYSVTARVGEVTYDAAVTVAKYDFDFQNLIIDTSVPSVAAAVSGEAIREFRAKIPPLYEQFSDELYWEGLFVQPVELGAGGFISTQFGEIRITNGDQNTRRSHYGMDFAVSAGTPVYAGNAGKVLLAEFLLNTGNTVVIDHGGGLKSYYFHMNSLDTQADAFVEKGALIGRVGSTGYSTGPHLHYEMRIGEQAISPSMLFEPDAGLYSAK